MLTSIVQALERRKHRFFDAGRPKCSAQDMSATMALGCSFSTQLCCSSLKCAAVRGERGPGDDYRGMHVCRSVRYRTEADPIITRLCWCRVCQYIAAGNAAAFASRLSIADSGNRMHRRFCPACGTHLFSEAESRPHLVFVRAGTLDDREVARPAATIWTASAPSWACIDADLPTFERQAPAPIAPKA
jgi:hypothetical protein